MSDKIGRFRVLSGDINYTEYGGKWYWHVRGRQYHVIELMNWADAVGEREAREVGYTYNVALREVDLDAIGDGVSEALRNCSWRLATDGTVINEYDGSTVAGIDTADLCLVECCHGYGMAAPLTDENGNNWRKLIREASKYSRELARDADAYWAAMERPVNAIGTSARKFMIGDYGFGARPSAAPPDETAHYRCEG